MKKLVLCSAIVSLFLIISTDIFAGDKTYGARAGWQRSVFVTDGEKSDPLSTFYLGVYRENQIIPLLRMGIGLEFMQTGTQLMYIPDSKIYKISYVGIPVNLKAKVGPLFALAGSGINFKVGESDLGGDKAKGIDIPAYAGIGWKFLMFNIEARYHMGLLEVFDNTKNQYLQIGVGVSF